MGDGGLTVYFATWRASLSAAYALDKGITPSLRRRGRPARVRDDLPIGPSPARPELVIDSARGRGGCPRLRSSSPGCVTRRRRDPGHPRVEMVRQTRSMSRCSATVLTVCGRVGSSIPGHLGWLAMVMGCRVHGRRPHLRCGMRGSTVRRSRAASTRRSPPRSGCHRAGHLQAPLVGRAQRGIDRGRCRTPVFVDLVGRGPAPGLLLETCGAHRVPFPIKRRLTGR